MTIQSMIWLFSEEMISVNLMDIVGRHVGSLYVIGYDGYYDKTKSGYKGHWYKCNCECGKSCLVRRDHLVKRRVKSCGRCFKIIPEGEHYRYICQNGNSFIFDREDYQMLSGRYCYVTSNGNGYGYAMSREVDGSQKQVSRLLLNLSNGDYVDHINGNHLDNRRCNLRIATVSENSQNARIRYDNSTGFKGVSYNKRRSKYRSYINNAGRQLHIGYFDNPEDAARAYDTAARFLYGEFACVNFPQPGEQGCRRNQTA